MTGLQYTAAFLGKPLSSQHQRQHSHSGSSGKLFKLLNQQFTSLQSIMNSVNDEIDACQLVAPTHTSVMHHLQQLPFLFSSSLMCYTKNTQSSSEALLAAALTFFCSQEACSCVPAGKKFFVRIGQHVTGLCLLIVCGYSLAAMCN